MSLVKTVSRYGEASDSTGFAGIESSPDFYIYQPLWCPRIKMFELTYFEDCSSRTYRFLRMKRSKVVFFFAGMVIDMSDLSLASRAGVDGVSISVEISISTKMYLSPFANELFIFTH